MTEELEKEAGDYADKHAFRVPYDGSNKFYDDVDFKASKDGYLAGAEPRDKRIAELESELDAIDKAGEHVRQQINDAFRNKRPYWELEKENTELKEMYHKSDEDNNKLRENIPLLAEAKELLKEFIFLLHNHRTALDTKTLINKAEQFLSEVEKW